jgi:hypothetical protein
VRERERERERDFAFLDWWPPWQRQQFYSSFYNVEKVLCPPWNDALFLLERMVILIVLLWLPATLAELPGSQLCVDGWLMLYPCPPNSTPLSKKWDSFKFIFLQKLNHFLINKMLTRISKGSSTIQIFHTSMKKRSGMHFLWTVSLLSSPPRSWVYKVRTTTHGSFIIFILFKYVRVSIHEGPQLFLTAYVPFLFLMIRWVFAFTFSSKSYCALMLRQKRKLCEVDFDFEYTYFTHWQ